MLYTLQYLKENSNDLTIPCEKAFGNCGKEKIQFLTGPCQLWQGWANRGGGCERKDKTEEPSW